MKQNKLIAITGGIGSGKSTLCYLLEKDYGYPVISADKITQYAYTLAKDELIKAFGDEIYLNGEVDRKKLADVVFSDKEKLNTLNSILHPIILSEMKNQAKKFDGDVFLEVPLLFESGFDKFVDEIWLVTAKLDVKLDRIISRDNSTRELAQKRIENQLSDEIKSKKSHIIFNNDSDIENLSKLLAVQIDKKNKQNK